MAPGGYSRQQQQHEFSKFWWSVQHPVARLMALGARHEQKRRTCGNPGAHGWNKFRKLQHSDADTWSNFIHHSCLLCSTH